MNRIKQAWDWLIGKLETGDLIPLLILVSAGHYITVLKEFDHEVTAVAVGILVDLGHFRSVRIAAKYRYQKTTEDQKGTGRLGEFILRWIVVALLTAIALSYHLRFYAQDWTLAAPIPILIAFLAYCEGRGPRGKRSVDERVEQLQRDLRKANQKLSQAVEQSAQSDGKLERANEELVQLEHDLAQAHSKSAESVELRAGDYSDFARICAGQNGELPKMSGKQLNILVAHGGIEPMAESTIKNWRDRYVKDSR